LSHVKIGNLFFSDDVLLINGVKNSFRNHAIVNHGIGFKNAAGYYTNSIEFVWLQTRYEKKDYTLKVIYK
jgi:hypothetical protein